MDTEQFHVWTVKIRTITNIPFHAQNDTGAPEGGIWINIYF
jgi:hypothetical protein